MNQWQPVEALKEPVDGFSQLGEEFFYQWQPVEEFAQPVEDFFYQWQPVEDFCNQWQPVEEFAQPVEDFYIQWQPVEEFAQPVEEFFQPVEDFSQPIEEFFIFVSVCVCVFFIHCSQHLVTFSFLFSFFMLPFTRKTKFKTISSSL